MFDFNITSMTTQNNFVQEIPLNLLQNYREHMFSLYTGERLEDMINSIKEKGVLVPIIVRPIADSNRYEILSGHNRVNASKQLNKQTIPAIIKENLSDEEAEIYVIETNLVQRSFSDLLISEQALILNYTYKKMFAQGKRNDITQELQDLENNENRNRIRNKNKSRNKRSLDIIGEEYNLSPSTIARIIRVLELIPDFQAWVDSKHLSLLSAVELSYIDITTQSIIYSLLASNNKKINVALAKELREFCNSLNGSTPSVEDISNIIFKPKKNNSITKYRINLNKKTIDRYFKNSTPEDISNIIDKALEQYFNNTDVTTDDNNVIKE